MPRNNRIYIIFCAIVAMTYMTASVFGWQWGSQVSRAPRGAQGLTGYRGGK